VRKSTGEKVGNAIGYGIVVMILATVVGAFIKYVIIGWLLK
jgi:uncharacterized membrane-anchored protein